LLTIFLARFSLKQQYLEENILLDSPTLIKGLKNRFSLSLVFRAKYIPNVIVYFNRKYSYLGVTIHTGKYVTTMNVPWNDKCEGFNIKNIYIILAKDLCINQVRSILSIFHQIIRKSS